MFHQVVYHGIFTVFTILFFYFLNIYIYSCGCVTLEYYWNNGVYGIWLGGGWSCNILKMYLKNLVTSTVFM